MGIRISGSHLSESYSSDPRYPNWRDPAWYPSVQHWVKTRDWTGILDDIYFKDRYLAKMPGELHEDRQARLQATHPEPYFKTSVKDNASLLSQFELASDAPATLRQFEEDVDANGSSLQQWALNPLYNFFRDGGVAVGCDFFMGRPRLLAVPMLDVFWVRYSPEGKLNQIALRYNVDEINGSNFQEVNRFWCYRLNESGLCEVFQWQEGDNPPEGGDLLIGADGLPFDRIPISDRMSFLGDFRIAYNRPMTGPGEGLLNLGEEHYNVKSEYSTARRKTALPTVVRYWEGEIPDPVPPFYAGTGKTQDTLVGNSIEYLELKGASLPELRQAVLDLEEKISKMDNKFFHTGTAVSATEADIENSKAKVGLPMIISTFESAMQDVFTIWERFANPDPAPRVGSIIVDNEVINPVDPTNQPNQPTNQQTSQLGGQP